MARRLHVARNARRQRLVAIGLLPLLAIGTTVGLIVTSAGPAHATGTDPSTTTLTSDTNPATAGEQVDLTAIVAKGAAAKSTDGTPTGTVTFKDGPNVLGSGTLSSGSFTLAVTFTSMQTGVHSLTAVYGGDPVFTGSTSTTVSENVTGTLEPTVALAGPATITAGEQAIFNATVTGPNGSPAPVGDVQFLANGNDLGAPVALMSGVAMLKTTKLSEQWPQLEALYLGDANYQEAASNTLSETVTTGTGAATMTLVASASPATIGEQVTFTATVSPVPPATKEGAVAFAVDGLVVDFVTTMNGVATYTDTAGLTAGGHTITAQYGGDSVLEPVTQSITESAIGTNAASVTVSSSANPINSTTQAALIAVVAGPAIGDAVPTGSVTFSINGGSAVDTVPLDTTGTATLSTTLPTGNDSVSAIYTGDGAYGESSGSLAGGEQVSGPEQTGTALTSPNPTVSEGTQVTLTATVTSTNTVNDGTVTFLDESTGALLTDAATGATSIPVNATGQAVLEVTLPPGVHPITAQYGGDRTFGFSDSNVLTETVTGGTISGQMLSGTTGVAGEVSACEATTKVCQSVTTDGSGNYTVPNLPDGTYNIVGVPSQDTYVGASGAQATIAGGDTVAADNINVTAATVMPSSVTITSPTLGTEFGGTTPGVMTTEASTLTVVGCANASPATVTIAPPPVGGQPVLVQTTSGTYTATIPAGTPRGHFTITYSLTCPNGGGRQGGTPFDAYADPSGTVVDSTDTPVSGATVTLLQFDSATGEYVAVPSGSAIMSPGNRTNPMTTATPGTFGWDVLNGLYEVQASKAGCTSSADQTAATSDPFIPPISGIVLELFCGTNAGTGGGTTGGGTGVTLPSNTSTTTSSTTSTTLATTTTTTPSGGVAPQRLAGADRIATSVAISQATFTNAGGSGRTAGGAVIANDLNFPDALVGAPLAVAKQGPVLLNPTASLDPTVQAELQRILAPGATVYIVGGTDVISSAVQSTITGLGFTVVRYGGTDRYGTAILVAQALGNPSTLLVATGNNYPDALSAGAAAGFKGAALLLTSDTTLPAEDSTYLSQHPGDTLFAIGAPAAAAVPNATPLVGSDRYATSVAVAKQFFPSVTKVGVADGLNFPDALSGGANMGLLGGPLLLTNPDELSTSIASYLQGLGSSVTAAYLYGGTLALSSDDANAVQAAL